MRFRSVDGIRVLSDGRVLVNDWLAHQVILLDSSLTRRDIIVDSAAHGATRAYGLLGGALIPYFGDSTFFVDATSGALVLLDPQGAVARVLAPPVDIQHLMSALLG
ncbi:MAG TPA: hypothetical protein VMH39_10405, partial [Gemmatimonadaceae bacterium]|nr:hypothetical protein [Gemmatimonadaceae bacterium]